MNRTKQRIDRTNGENSIQSQQIRILNHFLEGNSTEFRGKINENKFSLTATNQELDDVSSQLHDLEQEVREKDAADVIRHTELNSRLSRDEKRIESLESSSAARSETLTSITRSISEETNSRVSALQSHQNDIQSLRQTVTSIERQSSENRQTLNQNNQQLNEIRQKQVQQTSEKCGV